MSQYVVNKYWCTFKCTFLALCCHDRTSRVVRDDGRLPDNEGDLCNLLVRQRDEHLTLVDCSVRLLDVLNPQTIRARLWHVCYMESLRNEKKLHSKKIILAEQPNYRYSHHTDPINNGVLRYPMGLYDKVYDGK